MSLNLNQLDEVIYVITNEDNDIFVTTIPNNIGQAAIQFQDEGGNIGTPGVVNTIDFVGASVSLGLVNGKLTITISGGSGSGTVTNFSAGDLTPLFTTTEATATTTPVLSFAQITKAANLIFSGPSSGGVANPDFRALVFADIPKVICLAGSDETTALSAGTGKITFRMPFAMTLTSVRASLTTAQTSGNIFTVDINDSGTTILSTKLTIDNTEKTSTTAVTLPVISDTALSDDAEITIDIDQIGDGTAKGLKIYLIG